MFKKTLIFLSLTLLLAQNVFALDTFKYSTSSVERILDFDVEMTVHEDASVDVVEKITYDFSYFNRHGIYRDIPFLYEGEDRLTAIDLDIEKVVDERGNDHPYTDFETGGMYRVKIGDPDETVSGVQYYEIHYTAQAIVNEFDDFAELYWNVNGNSWNIPIDKVTASVTFEGRGAEAFMDSTCYTGGYGSVEQDCTIELQREALIFESTDLGVAEGMTIVAAIDKDLVVAPVELVVEMDRGDADLYIDGENWPYEGRSGYRLAAGEHRVQVGDGFFYKVQERVLDMQPGQVYEMDFEMERTAIFLFMQTGFPIGASVLMTFLVFLLWYKKGRDPKGRGTIMPYYKNPVDLKPGEMGVLYDEVAHMHDITATFIDLAVKGYLKIKKGKGKKDYTFVKKKAADAKLSEFEKQAMEALFKGMKKEVKMKDLQNKFYKELPKLKQTLYKGAVANGYFAKNPDSVRNLYTGFAIAAFFIFGALVFFGFGVIMSPFYGLIIVPLVLFLIIARLMSVKTVRGVEDYEKILGYREFLYTAERDRIAKLFSPDQYNIVFEKNLPYAMIFGVEKKWGKQFEDLDVGQPSWYDGGVDAWSVNRFMRNMNYMCSYAETVYASSPNSGGSGGWSGGSGFSGGFSGGGFGGGGGGSW